MYQGIFKLIFKLNIFIYIKTENNVNCYNFAALTLNKSPCSSPSWLWQGVERLLVGIGFVSVNGNDEADVEKYDIDDLCPFDDSATPINQKDRIILF